MDAVTRRPSKSRERVAHRAIFAANPPCEAKLVDQVEEKRIVDLAPIRLVASRHAGDLQMPDTRHERAQRIRQAPFCELQMIEIEMQVQVWMIHHIDGLDGLPGARQIKAAHAECRVCLAAVD